MKKLVSIILATVMLLSTVITVNAASFKDVKSSDWYYSSVNYVADQGIMQGTSNTKFSPKASLTRAMGVTLLYRVAGSPSVSGVNIPFTDVKGGQWYTDAVKWAYKNGIVTGKSATYFHTNGNITRAEFAAILYRYSNSQNYTLPVNRTDTFADSGKIPEWAFMAAWTMYRAEIINGRDDGSFDGNSKITRAEAAAMIERFMKASKDGTSDTTTDTQPPIENPDVPTTGKLVIKEKKYDYNGANVMILNVENQTNKHLNVMIKAEFFDANGKMIMRQNRNVEGFPANYRNYVVLQPGIKFDKCTYEVTTSSYSGTAYMQYLNSGSKVTIKPGPAIMEQYNQNPSAELQVGFPIESSSQIDLFYSADFVLFDKYGEIYWIENLNHFHIIPSDSLDYKIRFLTFKNIPYSDYVMAENLKGTCAGLVGFLAVQTSPPND